MPYTYEQIFSKNDEVINTLIAEEIMEEMKPNYEHEDEVGHTHKVIFSNEGWWVCVLDFYQGDKCSWSPVNFCGSLRWAWKVVEKINASGQYTMKTKFRNFLDITSPFTCKTESEAAKTICRAALLAKLDRIPKPV